MRIKRKYMLQYKPIQLSLEEKMQELSRFPMFDGSSPLEMESFARKMSVKLIRPMEVFVEEDLDETQAFFVYKGAISIFRTTIEGEIINIDLQKAPFLAGEMGLVDNKPSAANVMAIEESHALVLSQKDFQKLIKENPLVAVRLLKVFADKIRYFDVFLEQLLSKSLHERTWILLQKLGEFFPNREIQLSQEQIDDLIWGTRSRINEVLIKLEKEGKIKISRKKIILLEK